MFRFVLALVAFLNLGATAGAQDAVGDAAAGQRVFGQCRACHSMDRNQLGPNLRGVVGRQAAAVEGFRYSPAMRQKAQEGLTWSEESLRSYIRNPKELVPGGSMAYAGLRNDQQMNDLIAYLREQK